MIIGIDGNEANFENKVGVHQMAFEILWGLYRLQDKEKSGHRYIVYLKNPPKSDLPRENDYWKYKIIYGKRVWILTKLLPELFRGGRPDIFFSPSHYLPPIPLIPCVCLITDLGYLKFSGQFKKYDFWQLKYWTAISAIVSKYIITISNSSKKDIVRHYPFASKKTKVIYLDADRVNYNLKIPKNFVRQTLNKYRIKKSFILFMSTLKPSKNIEGLVEAYSKVRKKFQYQLVISGKKGWLYEEIFKKVRSLHLTDDVIFTDYVPDKERAAILSGAKVFVLPSFWEGFGIDVLNSFSCGVPVVVSKVASLPEVAGKAGIFIEPKDPESIASGIEKVLNLSSEEYNKLAQKGFKQLDKFSWGRTSRQITGVLERAGKYKIEPDAKEGF